MFIHRQKCKSTIGCATRTRAHTQLIASFPWTPARRAAYSRHSRSIEMCMWAYESIYSWRPEMDLYLSLLPAVFAVIPVLHTLSLRVHLTARRRLKACLGACLGACLREPRLTKLRFGRSRVFYGKLWPIEGFKSVKALTLTLT